MKDDPNDRFEKWLDLMLSLWDDGPNGPQRLPCQSPNEWMSFAQADVDDVDRLYLGCELTNEIR